MPPLVLAEAGVTLGNTYPHPIVELKPSRERALAAYQAMKENRSAQSDVRPWCLNADGLLSG